jgi:hypothetical protein
MQAAIDLTPLVKKPTSISFQRRKYCQYPTPEME